MTLMTLSDKIEYVDRKAFSFNEHFNRCAVDTPDKKISYTFCKKMYTFVKFFKTFLILTTIIMNALHRVQGFVEIEPKLPRTFSS